MPMRWDSLLVRHVASELDAQLRGARLRAVRLDGERHDLVLLFRETTLVWRLHPSRGYPILFPPQDPADGDFPTASKVRRVQAPADERLLVFELLPVRGRRRSVDIVVELLGNQWNAAVTEGPEKRIRHVLHRRGGRRRFAVGECWSPPAPSVRLGVDGTAGGADWAALSTGDPAEVGKTLVSQLAWTSPLNAGHILGLGGEDRSAEVIARRWEQMADPDRPPSPVILELERGAQPYPFPITGTPHRRYGSLLSALEASAERPDAADDVTGPALLPTELMKDLEAAVTRARRRTTRLRSELGGLETPESHQSIGDLLLARFHEIPAGSSGTELEDFENKTVTVVLDPTLSVQANAAKYYARAARTRRALERLPALITEAEAACQLLEALLEAARAGEASEEDVRAVLPRENRPASQGGGRAGASLPYRSFRSSGGLEIRVGRGAKHNDALTFGHSAPSDIWMHARHAAGAHVILRWDRTGSPPRRDLQEAAVLAALNSQARTSGSVPVDWTLRKYVRKPRRAPPGSVLPERVKTLFVEPDPTLPDRLSPDVAS